MPETRAVVALGSNLGDSPRTVEAALARLARLSQAPLVRSSLWRTSPVDCPANSPPFVNAVAVLAPLKGETPDTLLLKLLALEKEFGRIRKKAANEPRPLDLDLICFGDQTRLTPKLELPHPRAHERKFVLAPLAEVAPGLRVPGWTASAGGLLAALESDERVERLDGEFTHLDADTPSAAS